MKPDKNIDPDLPVITFTGNKGHFRLENPGELSNLYFPLANEAGMKSSITPDLKGDIKTDHNHFLMTPVTVEDLRRSSESREFWLRINGSGHWAVSGNSPQQKILLNSKDADNLEVEAGFLWHRVIRSNAKLGLKAIVTNFCPVDNVTCELMKVTVENTGNKELEIEGIAAIPVFGRSADNLRDHRHVTSLLNVIETNSFGVCLTPGMAFDERGHKENDVTYSVLGVDQNGNGPDSIYPTADSFIGTGRSLDWPGAVVDPSYPKPSEKTVKGSEAFGGLKFKQTKLSPGESTTIYLVLGITPDKNINHLSEYLTEASFEKAFSENEDLWERKLSKISFTSGDSKRDFWLKWVSLQPILRRIFGNSFLPHFDYGRGGRGWRDLWQDCLALMFTEIGSVREMLINNFAGVRIDGTNATIIGNKPGEFFADRNNIPRVWMDHGVWPLMTTRLYIDLSGDMDILLQDQTYFRDQNIRRCRNLDRKFNSDSVNLELNTDGTPFKSSLLEHILVQTLTAFFNVGQHNILRLEGADWNDGLDMARDNGESVAFSALYGHELISLADLLDAGLDKLPEKVVFTEPIKILLDTCFSPVDYENIDEKTRLLNTYLDSISYSLKKDSFSINVSNLISDLRQKGNWLLQHIKNNEWLQYENEGWFNGYYDNKCQRLDKNTGTKKVLTLTGQVFPVLSKAATDSQVDSIIRGIDKYLWSDLVGGYRLNTDLGELQPDMGRAFAFAYGHKENGSMFSHMAIMMAFALYDRGYNKNGFKILDTIFNHCINTAQSEIYPGIPEYIDGTGKGLYSYLTGSASWYLYTMLWQVFGIRGVQGKLFLKPQLDDKLFNEEGIASVTLMFAEKKLHVSYYKSGNHYSKISSIKINGNDIQLNDFNGGVIIERSKITGSKEKEIHINLTLS